MIAILLKEHSKCLSTSKLSSLYMFDAILRHAQDAVRKDGQNFDLKDAQPPKDSQSGAQAGTKEALLESAAAFLSKAGNEAEGYVVDTIKKAPAEQRVSDFELLWKSTVQKGEGGVEVEGGRGDSEARGRTFPLTKETFPVDERGGLEQLRSLAADQNDVLVARIFVEFELELMTSLPPLFLPLFHSPPTPTHLVLLTFIPNISSRYLSPIQEKIKKVLVIWRRMSTFDQAKVKEMEAKVDQAEKEPVAKPSDKDRSSGKGKDKEKGYYLHEFRQSFGLFHLGSG